MTKCYGPVGEQPEVRGVLYPAQIRASKVWFSGNKPRFNTYVHNRTTSTKLDSLALRSSMR
jgi:hypothetical protein